MVCIRAVVDDFLPIHNLRTMSIYTTCAHVAGSICFFISLLFAKCMLNGHVFCTAIYTCRSIYICFFLQLYLNAVVFQCKIYVSQKQFDLPTNSQFISQQAIIRTMCIKHKLIVKMNEM